MKFGHVTELVDRAKQYKDTTLELVKLRSIDKGTDALATASALIAVVVFASFMVVMLNVGLALWVGHLVGATYHGFFIVGGFYAIVALLTYLYRRRWIIKPLKNVLINFFIKDLDDDQA